MRITINGIEREVAEGVLLASLLPDELSGTAVAVNGEVALRQSHGSHALNEGDRVEIVTAVQGG